MITILLNYLILTGLAPSELRSLLMTESLIIYKKSDVKINLINNIDSLKSKVFTTFFKNINSI